MLDEPKHWRKYYEGDTTQIRFARKYSLSDRSRYYWPAGDVQNATLALLENLNAQPIPLTLLSQFFPVQFRKIREGVLRNSPNALVLDRIQEVLSDYEYACSGDEI
jgi:D-tagatose-1,6-bisphosphate aldolase subunit GatZ/KbaZ